MYGENGSAGIMWGEVSIKQLCFKFRTGVVAFCWKQIIRAFPHPLNSVVFPLEFSVLPQKINEYLRADFPSDANMRKIRVLHKWLDASDLHPETIFSSYEMHRFSTWYCLFQGVKCTISHPDTDQTGGWNRHNRNVRLIIRYSIAGYMTRLSGMNKPLLYRI